jgi:DNA-binding transcriptional LysR family regulator
VVDLSFEDRFVDLIGEGYDLALRVTGDEPPAGLIARPLRPMPFVIAASREYLKRRGVPRSLPDLAQHDSIIYMRSTSVANICRSNYALSWIT